MHVALRDHWAPPISTVFHTRRAAVTEKRPAAPHKPPVGRGNFINRRVNHV